LRKAYKRVKRYLSFKIRGSNFSPYNMFHISKLARILPRVGV
jgi:hypothetical protein